MKTLFSFIACIIICSSLKAINIKNALKIQTLNAHYFGIDISQFNYYFGAGKKGFNMGICHSYKPLHFLSFNSSLTYNNVHYQHKKGYYNLTQYNSKGVCLKLGTDLSLRLSPSRKTRAFIGCQYGLLNFKESGVFTMPNYWGTYDHYYQTKAKFYSAWEIIWGLKFNIKKVHIKMQLYSLFEYFDPLISYHDEVVEGYQTPFIPGYGFRRGGLNLIVGF